MKDLEDFTMKDVADYIVDEIALDRGITKKLARNLFINALSYNVVVEAINNQIDFLMED
ncbi:MAG: hypothetical protein ACK5JH_06970 [Anaerocolumna sp.]